MMKVSYRAGAPDAGRKKFPDWQPLEERPDFGWAARRTGMREYGFFERAKVFLSALAKLESPRLAVARAALLGNYSLSLEREYSYGIMIAEGGLLSDRIHGAAGRPPHLAFISSKYFFARDNYRFLMEGRHAARAESIASCMLDQYEEIESTARRFRLGTRCEGEVERILDRIADMADSAMQLGISEEACDVLAMIIARHMEPWRFRAGRAEMPDS